MNTTEIIIRVKYSFLETTALQITIIFYHIITMSSSVIGIIANFLILCGIKRQKSLQTYVSASLVNSCVVNITGCLVLIPLRVIIFGMYIQDSGNLNWICHFATFVRCFCEIFQLSMLVAVSYERYYAVLSPFDKVGRKKRVVTTIVFSWFLALSYSCSSATQLLDSSIYIPCKPQNQSTKEHWANYDSFISFPFGCVAFTIVLMFYICIFKALLRQSKKMQSHIKVGKQKVHPVENITPNVPKQDTVHNTSNINLKNIPVINAQPVTNTLLIPAIIDDTQSSGEHTAVTELNGNINIETINSMNDKPNVPSNKLPSISQAASCSIDKNFIPNSPIRVEIRGTSAKERGSSPVPGRVKCVLDDKNRTPRRTVDKFGIIKSAKTYEVYDAEGTVKIVNDNNDTVVGAVCMFNPKNREHGKRKIEAKIAKNIAIGIGLFGLVWIPLPLFVLINYNLDHLVDVQYHVLVILSAISVTVYTINPIVTIFMNRQIKSECIVILQSLKILRKK